MNRSVPILSTALLLAAGLVFAHQSADGAPREIRTVTSMAPAERAEGAKAHPQLLAELGGLYAGPQASYITNVGRKIAVQSSLSSQQGDFTISLLNSSANNAFAIPGGYVYVTRQLTALMNSEAELAGVLGHEIGHVAAQHAKQRQSTATRNSILGILGQVLVGAVAGDSGLGQLLQKGIGTGAQLLTLRFSRGQEYEADDLGIRYLGKAGYDPAALSSMLASLAAQANLDARVKGTRSSIPAWASTHPDPASRVSRALANARATGSTSRLRNAGPFLANIDGMLYDDDPREGIVEGNRFLHPALRLKFTVPTGFGLQNSAQAVTISGSQGQAQFTGGSYGGNLSAYVAGVFRQLAGQGSLRLPEPQRTTVNGLPAAYALTRATTGNGSSVDVTVFAYAFGPSSAYHFLMVTPAGRGVAPFQTMLSSMARMTDAEAGQAKPRKLRVVTVKAGDTINTLSARMAYPDYRTDRFLVLNALSPNARLQPGQRVKIVTY